MSLIICKACSNEISDKNSKCPECSTPIKKETSTSFAMGCPSLVIVFAVLSLLLIMLGIYISGEEDARMQSLSPKVINVSQSKAPTKKDLNYKIIKETTNEYSSKVNLEVELSGRVDIETLRRIAKSLRSTRTQYKRLWIVYFLPNMKEHNAGAWAISHFTPDLDLKILGTTIEEDKRLRSLTFNHKGIVGKWLDGRPMSDMVMIIFKKSGKMVMKMSFKDGSSMENKLIVKQVNGKTKYQDTNDTFGEYFMLEENGNLGMYSPNGKFSEAEKIK